MTKHELKLFDEKQIRTVWDEVEEKWYFCVADVIEALTDSNDVRQYIKRLRQRDSDFGNELKRFLSVTKGENEKFSSDIETYGKGMRASTDLSSRKYRNLALENILKEIWD